MFKSIYRYFFLFFTTVLSLIMFIHFAQTTGIDYIDLARVYGTNMIVRVILLLIFVLVLVGFVKLINKLSDKNLVIVMIVVGLVSVLFKLMWFINFPLYQYWDMEAIVGIAEFNGLRDSFISRSYLYIATQNTFPVIYLMFINLFDFGNNLNLVDMGRFVNGLWMTGTQILIMLTVCELKGKRSALFSLIVSTLFIPFTAFIVYVYNDVPSMFFYLLSTYMFIKFFRSDRLHYALIGCIALIFGQAFRSIGYIFAFTIFLYVFTILKKFNLKYILVVGLTIVAVLLPNFILDQSIKIAFKEDQVLVDNYGIPIYHYLGTGISKGRTDTPGFFDYQYWKLYTDNSSDKEFAEYLMRTRYLAQRGSYDFSEWADIIYRKFVYQWADGNFEVDYFNNIGHDGEPMYPQFSSKTSVRKFISTGFMGELFNEYNNALWHLIILLVAVHTFLFKGEKEEYLFVLPILGFWAFYTIWEVSSHYSFVVIPYVLILFSIYFENVYVYLGRKLKK